MRLRPLPPRRRPRRPLTTIHVLPTLVTLGNLLAGVLALSYLQDASGEAEAAQREVLWAKAAWLVFLGMFCDALDGRLARLTRTTSPFGAQIDSLADVVTFGVAPALLAKSIATATFTAVSGRLLLAFAAVYAVGAALRLARYNVESARVSPDGAGSLTLVFRGLPSPGAAGVIASLVLLRHGYALRSLDWALLLLLPVLGLLMVSRLPYPHLFNRYLEGRRTILVVVVLATSVYFLIAHFVETIAVTFGVYSASGPVLHVAARLTGRLRWAVVEEGDEAPDAVTPASDGEAEPDSTAVALPGAEDEGSRVG
jgi:CDP-diacylglycerol--serine O-phosphatidyltransferase